jgi:hypothetical protein
MKSFVRVKLTKAGNARGYKKINDPRKFLEAGFMSDVGLDALELCS